MSNSSATSSTPATSLVRLLTGAASKRYKVLFNLGYTESYNYIGEAHGKEMPIELGEIVFRNGDGKVYKIFTASIVVPADCPLPVMNLLAKTLVSNEEMMDMEKHYTEDLANGKVETTAAQTEGERPEMKVLSRTMFEA
jgi:hypothetical protein